jgi:hypothetical protein
MATNKVKRREIYLPAKHLCSLQQGICSFCYNTPSKVKWTKAKETSSQERAFSFSSLNSKLIYTRLTLNAQARTIKLGFEVAHSPAEDKNSRSHRAAATKSEVIWE